MRCLPIPFPTTFFLHFLRVSIDVARLGEIAGEVLLVGGGAGGNAGMVAVILLVGAGH